jgi:hypothetical protein
VRPEAESGWTAAELLFQWTFPRFSNGSVRVAIAAVDLGIAKRDDSPSQIEIFRAGSVKASIKAAILSKLRFREKPIDILIVPLKN